jgi:sugar/nucleoside kinase (ribokinase family)
MAEGRRRHIVCLGDVMVDVVARLPGPLALGSDVTAPIRIGNGGSAANTAAWLTTTTTPATLIGRVGDDAAGTQVHQELTSRGITDRLQIDWELPTGTCIVLVDSTGERTMIPDPGANAALDPSGLQPDDFAADRHLHVSGYALLGGARPAALAALGRARAARMTISVDAASQAPLRLAGARQFLDWIGPDVLLFANSAEAEVLTGSADPGAAARKLADRLGRAVVKAGDDGAHYADADVSHLHEPAVPLATVVDTTGAGDAFAAGFLAALGAGDEPARALHEANALAAVACQSLGGRPVR